MHPNIEIQSKVIVIVVTYNGMKWIKRCLESIVHSSIPLDAYIIDNGSNDGTQQFIATNYPHFKFYQSPKNLGFGAANNIALEYAIHYNYDYVYLLNQDAWVDVDTISVLIEQHKLNPEFGVLSPLQINAEKTKLDRSFLGVCNKESPQMLSDCIFNSMTGTYINYGIMAAHWLISRECLMKVGYFSPVFFHYGEDNNYADRVKYHRLKAGIVVNTFGVHDREYRDIPKCKEVYMIFINFLILSSNINRSFFNSLLKAYIKTIYSALILTFKYKDIVILFKFIFKFYPIFKIHKDRTKNTLHKFN